MDGEIITVFESSAKSAGGGCTPDAGRGHASSFLDDSYCNADTLADTFRTLRSICLHHDSVAYGIIRY